MKNSRTGEDLNIMVNSVHRPLREKKDRGDMLQVYMI